MARTVEEGFRIFLQRLTPTLTESEAAKRHRRSIKGCLEKNFGMTRFFRTGSFGNGTSISGYSDVDYFAVIPRENMSNDSTKALQQVREVLDKRFPNTGVTVRTPAVVVPFGQDISETTEVVPARFATKANKLPVYIIADGSGDWMPSSPEIHKGYVRYVDEQKGRKVRPLVRFLKAWKYYRNVSIASFYLELRITQYASKEDSIYYPIDVIRILKQLWDIELRAIRDPMGISGYVYACSTKTKHEEALSKLKTALSRAIKAVAAEKDGKIHDAFYWWDLLFNGNFPAYG